MKKTNIIILMKYMNWFKKKEQPSTIEVYDAERLFKECIVSHYDTTLQEEIKKQGEWIHYTMGAEGEYLDKGEYRLQFIQQSKRSPSVCNENWGIDGVQNLHIFTLNEYHTIFFGYCDSIEEFNTICNLLRI